MPPFIACRTLLFIFTKCGFRQSCISCLLGTIVPAFAHPYVSMSYFVILIIFQTFLLLLLGKTQWLKPLTLARHCSNHSCDLFSMTRDPGKAHRTNKPPPPEEFWKGQKEDATCPTDFPESASLEFILLSNAWATQRDPESEWLARNNPETNPITVKPETALRLQATSQSSSLEFPYPPALYPRAPSQ